MIFQCSGVRGNDSIDPTCTNTAANITAKPYDLEICVSKCTTVADCPTDTCPGVAVKPDCFLEDGTGQKYCGLPCRNFLPDQKCSSDEHMVCGNVAGGVCGYYS